MSVHFNPFVPGTLAQSAAATVTLLPAVARFSLRARDPSALSQALGLDLPTRIGIRASAGGVEVLCLGPDEWQVLATEPQAGSIVDACARAYGDAPHSLTDITDRELTLRIDGPLAADLLTLGCPRDIASINVGQGRRTLFDGATVLLWRDADQDFRMDVWRSFAPHVVSLLATGCTELALG